MLNQVIDFKSCTGHEKIEENLAIDDYIFKEVGYLKKNVLKEI